ncbi:ATP-binding protein [Xenorhabdus khoisanae]|uniref:ATP-binding protein n=1 Tax=Xenorhabdus khoisanae TaxID=880157 RepID=A0A0J5IN92_9GAMM|nr:AAA family ATPase [Xenorhabdus khoisanae]KMJ44690.1 ATP-binding protein [Xenorhabdus khoisanae]
MGTATLILGESGTGKSTSLRNIKPEETLLIQTVRKPLPFRSAAWTPFNKDNPAGAICSTDSWQQIIAVIKGVAKYGKSIVVIDDFQYLMANEFMRRSEEKSFDKFTEIGSHAWNVIDTAIRQTPDNLRIYFLSHTEETQMGKVKMKTIGRMLDEKITVEGMFTIVLKTQVKDGQYLFTTQNSGFDTVKSPMGLFDSSEIENDLKAVDEAICEYYGIETRTTDEVAA